MYEIQLNNKEKNILKVYAAKKSNGIVNMHYFNPCEIKYPIYFAEKRKL